jgi:hypothetical protein
MKFDLKGALEFLAQLQTYEGGSKLTIPLDLTAELGPKATGSLTIQQGQGWSISIGGSF